MTSAGMRSLALAFPSTVRTNDYWREHYPDLVATADKRTLAKLWSAPSTPEEAAQQHPFDLEMGPYLSDAFRGAVERRVLSDGQTPLSLEVEAARRAMRAAGLGPGDVDLLITSSFFSNEIYIGNAAFLARELGLTCAAWNLETACSSSVVSFRTACSLVRDGEYRRVLVVTSCNYSQLADEADTLSWFLGDGAAAFVVSEVPDGAGYVAGHTVHTADTCGSFFLQMVVDEETKQPRMRMLTGEGSGKVLRETAIPYLRECCEGAARRAGVSLDDIDFFVFNTPTAWYSRFCARALGVPQDRTISTYPIYANTGPVLMPSNLYHAAREGRVKPGALVMLYAVGSVSSASAAVVRWGDVALADEIDVAPVATSR